MCSDAHQGEYLLINFGSGLTTKMAGLFSPMVLGDLGGGDQVRAAGSGRRHADPVEVLAELVSLARNMDEGVV